MTDAAPALHQFDPDWCMRPGVLVAEILDYHGLKGPSRYRHIARAARGFMSDDPRSITDIAESIRSIVEDAEPPVLTEPIARALHHLFVASPGLWLNLEANYRRGLAAGKRDISDD